MTKVDDDSYSKQTNLVEDNPIEHEVIKAYSTQPVMPVAPVASASTKLQSVENLEAKLETIGVDSRVLHKKFGKGIVVRYIKNENSFMSSSLSVKRNSSFPMLS